MRDKRDGWDNRFRSTIKFENGKEEYNSMLSNLWNRIYFSELASRISCSNCQFSNNKRQGDLTLGDFWGIEKLNEQIYNKNGVSLVLINTNKGKELFENINDDIISIPAMTNEKEHPNLFAPTKQSLERKRFMNEYIKKGFSYIANKYFGYNRILDIKLSIYKIINTFLKI